MTAHEGVVASTLVVIFCAFAFIWGWFVGNGQATAPRALATASPVVVQQQAPFPPELIAAAKADVARATELAPTPTPIPSPTPSPTPDPTKFCGIDSVPGHVCRWPKPPVPTPTPYPTCATPAADDLCIWRQP